MAGPAPKDPAKRQRRNRDSGRAEPAKAKPVRGSAVAAVLPADAGVEIPAPSKHWSADVVEQWNEAWRAMGPTWVAASDLGACRRLFDYRHRLAELEAMDVVTEGSQKQLVASPWAKAAQEIRSEVRQLEDRFGLSPLARLRIGITLGEAHESLSKLAERLDRDLDEPDFDPLAVLEADVVE